MLSLPSSPSIRWFFLLAEVDPEDGDPEDPADDILVAIGYEAVSDRFVAENQSWVQYKTDVGRNWLSVNCLIEYEGYIYKIFQSEVRTPMHILSTA